MWESIKKSVYIARKAGFIDSVNKNEIQTFLAPVSYRINLQPVSGYLDIKTYGARVTKMYKAVIDSSEYANIFSEGDKAYLEGVTPTGETINGFNANYEIVSVRPVNRTIHIYFEKLSKGE